MADPPPLAMFDHVYAEPHPPLRRQREQFAAYLDSIAEPGEAAVTRPRSGRLASRGRSRRRRP